jgi:septum formation protein
MLWLAGERLVLASKSVARRAILQGAGIPFDVHPAEIDERALEDGAPGDAGDTAGMLARAKAALVAARLPGRLVLGADQTLALGTRRFSKPADRTEARDQLCALAGRTHELHSAIALMRRDTLLFTHVEVARLHMRPFSDAFLEKYLDAMGGAVTDSVGAYQLEGLGIHLFEQVDGHHSTILGLPLLPLLKFLRQAGYLAQ